LPIFYEKGSILPIPETAIIPYNFFLGGEVSPLLRENPGALWGQGFLLWGFDPLFI